ncbi:MAG: transglycosylase SLT domain-containing protein, partial [Oceanobacter sp.]
ANQGQENASHNDSRQQQRALFIEVEEQLRTAPFDDIDSLISPLADYPLYPYLKYQAFQRFTRKLSQAEVNAFLDEYPLFPKRERLQRAWLTSLAKQRRWEDWKIAYLRLPIERTEYQCDLARALIATGESEKGMAMAEQLWTVGESQPDECNSLFDVWMKKGNPTMKTAAKRYWLAAEAGEMQLARYLHRFMAKADVKKAKSFERLRSRSRKVPEADLSAFPPSAQEALMVRAFQRLARGDAEKAAKRWLALRDKLQTQSEGKAAYHSELDLYIGKWLAYEQSDDAFELMNQIDPDYQLAELTESRLRQLLASEQVDWSEMNALMLRLPESKQTSDRWLYWRAKALDHLGTRTDNDEAASFEIWQQLARSRSFYGFLAADQLALPHSLNDEPLVLDAEVVDPMRANRALIRAREWLELERYVEATRDWNSAKSAFDELQRNQLAALAMEWGWSFQAIMEAIYQQQWNFLDARFPALFQETFVAAANKNSIDSLWATAIARQESAFKPEAMSPVGARGLMQLMPSTARQTSRKHGLPLKNTAQLLDPEVNIALGSAYLGEMLKQFDGNRAYASAAYNAGPHRVTQWLEERGHLPLDAWLETIPYEETRNYVLNVLAFRVVYAERAGLDISMLSDTERSLLAYQPQPQSQDNQTDADLVEESMTDTVVDDH